MARISLPSSDKEGVSRFAEHAQSILDAAESASAHGESCTEMTILIGQEGGIHMLADSDWPLDSLAWHHGAQTAYRVSQRFGSVRVEGREGSRTCVFESVPPAQVARRLLSARN
ncbi:MAG: hypothetical protein ABSB35_14925 [Bryobacteraceae bacterium]